MSEPAHFAERESAGLLALWHGSIGVALVAARRLRGEGGRFPMLDGR
jgi:hypothetical protein